MERQTTRYYEIYKAEERLGKLSLYERIVTIIPKSLRMETGLGLEERLDPVIEQAQLGITTPDVISFAIYLLFMCMITSVLIVRSTQFSLFLLLSLFFTSTFLSAAVVAYPFLKAQRVRMLIVGQSPLAILYMVISLRVTPTLESAVAFAAKNVPDPIGLELKKILWQVQTRAYYSMPQALYSYSSSIKSWAPGFSDSLYLLANSIEQPTEEERLRTLKKAIEISLLNTRNIMERFARGLSLPVMATNALGVILPVLGLVMAPVVAIFSEATNMSLILAMIYCVVLPIALIGLIAAILAGRPGSFSSVDLSNYPNIADISKIKIFGMKLEPWIVGAGIFIILSSPTTYIAITQGKTLFTPGMGGADSLKTVPLLLGIGLGLGITLRYGNDTKMKLVRHVKELEREFSSALFQLSNIMQQGMPFEEAIKQAAYALKGTNSAEFFSKTIQNVENMGYPLELAIMDKDIGSIRVYPSSLVKNIILVLLNAAQQSSVAASASAQSISEYLQNIQSVESKIEDLLSESISSMKFQSYVLVPAVSGVVVGLSQMITQILLKVAEQIQSSFTGGTVSAYSAGMIGGLLNIRGTVPPSLLQLIVGTYTTEVLILIGLFSAGLEKGTEDEISIKSETGSMLIIGILAYIAVTSFVTLFFSTLVAGLLK